MTPDYTGALAHSRARAAVLWEGAEWESFGLEAALFAPSPRHALAAVSALFRPGEHIAPGIHASAVVDRSAEIGEGVDVGPLAVIGRAARIGAGSRLLAQVTVGAEARIGAGCLLHPGARIGPRVVLGDGVTVLPNAVIGAEGFSFVASLGIAGGRGGAERSGDESGGEPPRIHSLGSVRIGDRVEIGAGTTIDRGTVSDTVIGAGTKIDNLVQIAHNVRIGENCLICGQVGIAGSAEIGDRVVLGGRAGVADHVRVGADSILAGGALLARNVPAGSIMVGAPALPRAEFHRQWRALRRLPRLVERMRALLDSLRR